MSKLYEWFDDNIGYSGLFLSIFTTSLVIVIIISIVVSINGIGDRRKHVDYLINRIGDRYVMGKDTVLVLEFDDMEYKYLLSNGFKVVPEIIYKSKKVK